MSEDKKYNGWSNYATWRVKLEIFDDECRYEEEVTPEQLEDECEEVISGYGEIKEGLALGYARAFLDDVDWYEIADSINKIIRENKKGEQND